MMELMAQASAEDVLLFYNDDITFRHLISEMKESCQYNSEELATYILKCRN